MGTDCCRKGERGRSSFSKERAKERAAYSLSFHWLSRLRTGSKWRQAIEAPEQPRITQISLIGINQQSVAGDPSVVFGLISIRGIREIRGLMSFRRTRRGVNSWRHATCTAYAAAFFLKRDRDGTTDETAETISARRDWNSTGRSPGDATRRLRRLVDPSGSGRRI